MAHSLEELLQLPLPLNVITLTLYLRVREGHFISDCHVCHLLAEDKGKWNSNLPCIDHFSGLSCRKF